MRLDDPESLSEFLASVAHCADCPISAFCEERYLDWLCSQTWYAWLTEEEPAE